MPYNGVARAGVEPADDMRLFNFGGQEFQIIGETALFWPAIGALLVADLHLEKGSAFAQFGQMLPPYDSLATLQSLDHLARGCGARQIICLGDNFHDDAGPARLSGEAAALLERMAGDYRWTWTIGNHDRLLSQDRMPGYTEMEYVEELSLHGIMLRHDVTSGREVFEISGHFHPKFRISAKGRSQSRRCFVCSGNKLIMPAFGSYAGGMDAGEVAQILADISGNDGKAFAMVPYGSGIARFALS